MSRVSRKGPAFLLVTKAAISPMVRRMEAPWHHQARGLSRPRPPALGVRLSPSEDSAGLGSWGGDRGGLEGDGALAEEADRDLGMPDRVDLKRRRQISRHDRYGEASRTAPPVYRDRPRPSTRRVCGNTDRAENFVVVHRDGHSMAAESVAEDQVNSARLPRIILGGFPGGLHSMVST